MRKRIFSFIFLLIGVFYSNFAYSVCSALYIYDSYQVRSCCSYVNCPSPTVYLSLTWTNSSGLPVVYNCNSDSLLLYSMFCPSDTPLPDGDLGDDGRPSETKTCWDNSVIPVADTCPPETKTCWDNSVIPVADTCPPEEKTCPSGDVIPINDTCPLICPPGYLPIGHDCSYPAPPPVDDICPVGYVPVYDPIDGSFYCRKIDNPTEVVPAAPPICSEYWPSGRRKYQCSYKGTVLKANQFCASLNAAGRNCLSGFGNGWTALFSPDVPSDPAPVGPIIGPIPPELSPFPPTQPPVSDPPPTGVNPIDTPVDIPPVSGPVDIPVPPVSVPIDVPVDIPSPVPFPPAQPPVSDPIDIPPTVPPIHIPPTVPPVDTPDNSGGSDTIILQAIRANTGFTVRNTASMVREANNILNELRKSTPGIKSSALNTKIIAENSNKAVYNQGLLNTKLSNIEVNTKNTADNVRASVSNQSTLAKHLSDIAVYSKSTAENMNNSVDNQLDIVGELAKITRNTEVTAINTKAIAENTANTVSSGIDSLLEYLDQDVGTYGAVQLAMDEANLKFDDLSSQFDQFSTLDSSPVSTPVFTSVIQVFSVGNDCPTHQIDGQNLLAPFCELWEGSGGRTAMGWVFYVITLFSLFYLFFNTQPRAA